MTETTEPSSTPRSFSQRARWAVPAVAAVAVAGAFVAPPLLASAGAEGLPDVTPAELISSVAAAEPVPMSGTLVYTARLGLPEIPFGEVGGADPIALLGGSSTLRVWTDGSERSRVSLLGSVSEYSVVRDGAEAWTYSSSDEEVVHYALSAEDQARYDALAEQARAGTLPEVAGELPTPDEVAGHVLAQAEQFSSVTLDSELTVAGRDAYQLVVTPKAGAETLIARTVVAVDAETSTPLRVQVWSTQDEDAPALEVGFTDVAFEAPDDAVLAFSAPAGASVKDVEVPLPSAADLAQVPSAKDAQELPPGVTVTGTGWESVTEVTGLDVANLVAGDPAALTSVPGAGKSFGSESAQDLIQEFAPTDENGQHGVPDLDTSALYDQLTTEVPEGRLLSSSLLSVLVTTDGRVFAGAVPADVLRGMA
ncbi:outer membrane lipoprotein carrier protein LolA [Cellulomonas sp. 179-A 4D5 NHS]|uniref:LolA family protein n=1 Tax=Cellulomonas sp. 179-A 4D5 NHS TaxID=3142378 RepID=UPI0039A2C8B2